MQTSDEFETTEPSRPFYRLSLIETIFVVAAGLGVAQAILPAPSHRSEDPRITAGLRETARSVKAMELEESCPRHAGRPGACTTRDRFRLMRTSAGGVDVFLMTQDGTGTIDLKIMTLAPAGMTFAPAAPALDADIKTLFIRAILRKDLTAFENYPG